MLKKAIQTNDIERRLSSPYHVWNVRTSQSEIIVMKPIRGAYELWQVRNGLISLKTNLHDHYPWRQGSISKLWIRCWCRSKSLGSQSKITSGKSVRAFWTRYRNLTVEKFSTRKNIGLRPALQAEVSKRPLHRNATIVLSQLTLTRVPRSEYKELHTRNIDMGAGLNV